MDTLEVEPQQLMNKLASIQLLGNHFNTFTKDVKNIWFQPPKCDYFLFSLLFYDR